MYCFWSSLDTVISKCFIQVSDQLCAKYSKEYGKLCRTNQIGTVNDRVLFAAHTFV